MGGKPNLDIIGQKFGLLTVIRLATPEEKDSVKTGVNGGYFYCECECGGKKIARSSHLKAGLVKSCGCIYAKKKEAAKANAEAKAERQKQRIADGIEREKRKAEAKAEEERRKAKKERQKAEAKAEAERRKAEKERRELEKQRKSENPRRTTMQKYEIVKKTLCEKHNRMCLTTKCPLAKFGCYDFVTVSAMLAYAGTSGRGLVVKTIKQAAKDNGIEL